MKEEEEEEQEERTRAPARARREVKGMEGGREGGGRGTIEPLGRFCPGAACHRLALLLLGRTVPNPQMRD
jgi:hypothetical protein